MSKHLPDSVAAMVEAGKTSHAPTAPLAEFIPAYEADDNLWWRIGCGHHQNLFDAALEEIDRLSNEVMRYQTGQSYEVGHEHGVQAGIAHAGGCKHGREG